MVDYQRDDARAWARANMHGLCGCLLPTLSSSLREVNEVAIRHDVRLEADLGYWGTLIVSECGTTDEEMRDVVDIAVAQAREVGLRTMLLASFPTLETTLEMVRYADTAGVDLVLLAYPLLFHPTSEAEVLEFTKTVAEATDVGIMLFCVNQWDFGHLHPGGFSPGLIGQILAEVPTVVAIKNEVGGPGVGGIAEVFMKYGDDVVVTDPFEQNAPAWVNAFDMQFMGSSNYEYMGDAPVKIFEQLRNGATEDAMKRYWQVHPARQANAQLSASYMPGTGLIHRLLWKYQYWLNGFNGGPIRQPHLRLAATQRALARDGLVKSGIQPAEGTDEDFFVGRFPLE